MPFTLSELAGFPRGLGTHSPIPGPLPALSSQPRARLFKPQEEVGQGFQLPEDGSGSGAEWTEVTAHNRKCLCLFQVQPVQHVYPPQVQYVEGGDAVYTNGAL